MVRTQVQLTEAQVAALKRLAVERGVSIAALIRDAVDRTLEDGDMAVRHRRALAVVGKFPSKSGASDVSENHDRYLVDAYFE